MAPGFVDGAGSSPSAGEESVWGRFGGATVMF